MFQKLLVPLDRSDFAEQAIGQAAAIARASEGVLDLVLVHEPFPFGTSGDAPWRREAWQDEERYLQSIANEISGGTGVPVTCAVIEGEKVEMICKRAWDVGADLIVMTSHGRTGLSRAWLGSAADGVIRHSATPVLMLRPIEGKPARLAAHHLFQKILLPLDGSPLAAEALSSATSLAQCAGASITLLRVVVPVPIIAGDAGMPFVYPYPISMPDVVETNHLTDDAKRELADVARHLQEQGIENVASEVVVAANVARGIIDFANGHDTDLIAMSTHGRGGSRLFLGSVADKLIRGCEIPVLVYRPLAVRERTAIIDESAMAIPSLGGG
jgi:nucleotide-binding universal stress UspA family protein